MTAPADLPPIWDVITPLSRERAQSAIKAACRRTVEHLRFRAPRTSHAVAVIVLGLDFYSKDPYGVGDTIDVFLFPDLYPSVSSEAALLTRRWDTILCRGAFIYFADTSLLISKQRV